MKKTFCDFCGDECVDGPVTGFTETVTLRKQSGLPQQITVKVALTATPLAKTIADDVCGDCLWVAIDQLNPQPKAAEASA